MKIYKISSSNYEQLFTQLGCDTYGIHILTKKATINTLYIKDLHTGAANILKQDALSIGADLAVPKGTILNTTPYVDCILIGNNKHFEILAKKEMTQPFGLKDLAKELKNYIKPKSKNIEIMGVINVNDDSFYQQSRSSDNNTSIEKINNMINDGADIIDIGAVSSRPGSLAIDPIDELSRIKAICDSIKKEKLYEQVKFSIDSYTPKVIEYALNSGFTIINDITGLRDDTVCKLASQYQSTVVIMHMKGLPDTMQIKPTYTNVILDIDSFFKKQSDKAIKYGIKNIILDVGIGFGKTLAHNIELFKNMDNFLHFDYPILCGASRKSMIEMIVPNTPVDERLSGTLALHLKAIEKGASIIRCHDVKEHYQAIKVWQTTNI